MLDRIVYLKLLTNLRKLMNTKKYTVVEELDSENIEGIPERSRLHYISLGYKPYLMGDGKTKWLTDAQRVYKETKSIKGMGNKKMPVRYPHGYRRKHKGKGKLMSFLSEHILLISIVIAIILVIMYILR